MLIILANKTTAVLRSIPSIERILYVLNKSEEQAMHHFYELATGGRSKLNPKDRSFLPTNIYPVDLLPHTIHVESVVKCVRM